MSDLRIAKSAEILRAYQRDSELRLILRFLSTELFEQVMGHRRLSQHLNSIRLASDLVYYWSSTLRGK